MGSKGRPREFDRKKVAESLIEWAKKPDSINLCKFCALHDPIIPPTTLLRWVKEDEDFREAYDSAKMFLGFRREEWLNSEALHVKAYDLNATNYDLFMRDERRQQAEFESALKQKEDQQKIISNEDAQALSNLIKSMPQVKDSVGNAPPS